jgi:F420-non-reducing hydrogenase small subunit
MAGEKLKLAFYWAAGCGGCEVSVLDINEKILDVAKIADIVMWPVAIDAKYDDIRKMPDKSIDVTFFNGAIRCDENEEMAHLFRNKSKILIAFGICATGGGIVGLGNLYKTEDILKEVFWDSVSTENDDNVKHVSEINFPEGKSTLPVLNCTVKALDQVVEVDYYVTGCPPQASQVMEAITAITTDSLPPKGSVIGPQISLCDECERKPKEGEFKKIEKLQDRLDVTPDPDKCLLEQGFICMGPATRAGCGAKCTSANVPCTGCNGPAPNVKDQGAKMMSALASILQTEGEEKKSFGDVEKELAKVTDPVGIFYRYYLASSILKRKENDYAPPE